MSCRLVAALLALAPALAPAQRAAPPPVDNSLLAHASSVVVGRSDHHYWWLSDREVLLIRDRPARSTRDHVWRAFVRRDVRTGAEKELGALTGLYNRARVLTWPVDLSPDRRWLLWQNAEGRVFVARLDGTGYQHWKVRNSSDPVCWSPDSRGVVSIDLDGTWRHTATRRAVADPEQVSAFPLDLDPRVALSNVDGVCVTDLMGSHSLIVVKRTPGAKSEDRLTIWEATTWEAPPVARQRNIALPDGAAIDDEAFSPNATRVAWLVSYSERGHRTQGVWVWDTQTAALHHVGSIELGAAKGGGALHSLAWLPAGDRVSLMGGKQRLYVIAIGRAPQAHQ